MNSMQKIEEAARIILDPIHRCEQIRGLEKRLRFSRVVLLICAAATILSVIAYALGDRSNAPGIFMGVTAVLLAGHMAVFLRLVQLKVEEERDKKA